MAGRYDPAKRDQGRTGFTRILEQLLTSLPGAGGIALVDELGECVDYAGVLDSFDLRLAAAHGQLELLQSCERLSPHLGPVSSISFCAHRRSYVAWRFVEHYTLIVVYVAAAPLVLTTRALVQAECDMREEGGWALPSSVERWVMLEVQARPHDRWKPQRVNFNGAWMKVNVIGAMTELNEGEWGFRVRTETGRELTLVREVTGNWFADIRLETAKNNGT